MLTLASNLHVHLENQHQSLWCFLKDDTCLKIFFLFFSYSGAAGRGDCAALVRPFQVDSCWRDREGKGWYMLMLVFIVRFLNRHAFDRL